MARSTGKVRAARLTDLAALGELSRLAQGEVEVARSLGLPVSGPADRRVQPVPAAAGRVPAARCAVRLRARQPHRRPAPRGARLRAVTSGRSWSSTPLATSTPATSGSASSSTCCATAPSGAPPGSTSRARTPTTTSSCSCRRASSASATSGSCSGTPGGHCRRRWRTTRHVAPGIRSVTPFDAVALSRLYAAVTPAPVQRLECVRLPDWERQGRDCRVPRSSLVPILRFADVYAFVLEAPDGGRDGTQLDALRAGRGREGGPAALPQGHGPPRRGRGAAPPVRAGRDRGAGGLVDPPPGGRHRPRAHLRVAARPAPRGRGLRGASRPSRS